MVKLWPVIPAFPFWFQFQLPAEVPGKAVEGGPGGPTAWAAATHVGDGNRVPGSRLWFGPALATEAIGGRR